MSAKSLFPLSADEFAVAVRQIQLLRTLAPGEVQLDGVGDFVAAARRISEREGHVALERFDELFAVAERLEVHVNLVDATELRGSAT